MISKPLSNDTVLSVAPDWLSTMVDAELVLMNVRSGVYYGLNPMGTEIMSRLAVPIRFGDLAAALVREYDAPEEVITAETRQLIEQLREHGLIEGRD